ncbi:MAG: hypothetical protein ABIQ02_03210 [Saprospiraceae bacterium]
MTNKLGKIVYNIIFGSVMLTNILGCQPKRENTDCEANPVYQVQTDARSTYVPNTEHGFWAQGEARELKLITLTNGNQSILSGNNKGPLQCHEISGTIINEE